MVLPYEGSRQLGHAVREAAWRFEPIVVPGVRADPVEGLVFGFVLAEGDVAHVGYATDAFFLGDVFAVAASAGSE